MMPPHLPPHHPLVELLASLLYGIETVPRDEQRKMVTRAIREAVKWHDQRVRDLQSHLADAEQYVGPPYRRGSRYKAEAEAIDEENFLNG